MPAVCWSALFTVCPKYNLFLGKNTHTGWDHKDVLCYCQSPLVKNLVLVKEEADSLREVERDLDAGLLHICYGRTSYAKQQLRLNAIYSISMIEWKAFQR